MGVEPDPTVRTAPVKKEVPGERSHGAAPQDSGRRKKGRLAAETVVAFGRAFA